MPYFLKFLDLCIWETFVHVSTEIMVIIIIKPVALHIFVFMSMHANNIWYYDMTPTLYMWVCFVTGKEAFVFAATYSVNKYILFTEVAVCIPDHSK